MQMNFNELKKKLEISDFFNSDNVVKNELINDVGTNNVKEIAELMNEKIEDPVLKDRSKRPIIHSKDIKINQIRKFYDSFLNIFNAQVVPMNEKKVRILMLKANIEYSANRLEIRTLEIFIKNRLDIVLKQNDQKAFDRYLNAFKLHFEALVGYFPKKQ